MISDTRESRDYNESHVITAKYAPRVRRINNNNNNNNINNNNIIIIIIVITFQFFIFLFSSVKKTCFNFLQNDIGAFTVPSDAELETKQHVVVYDSTTSSLKDKSECLILYLLFIQFCLLSYHK